MKPIDTETADAIWNILAEECGAKDGMCMRESFNGFMVDGQAGAVEFRFMGALGFGGKIYIEHDRWRVSCYREEETDAKREMIRKANERLKKLRQRVLESPR